ncbi:MAG: RagB/SusD family nutrient uptake outer membrane protein [Chitinophagaceae bacterium]|nr:RagB/SusD family nutrient uptake outer membrane protein [Chitinophagaceae bacterium]
MYSKNKIINLLSLLLIVSSLFSCRKYLDTGSPRNELAQDRVFASDNNAQSAVAGMYASMYATRTFQSRLRVITGHSADEFYMLQGATYSQFRNNALATGNNIVLQTWSDMYAAIYQANAIIEGLNASTQVSSDLKKQLKGEALFMRAFCHFYLINLYGKAPLILETDIAKTALLPRTPVEAVYQQIVEDLQEAQQLLPEDYGFNNDDRSRVNKWAATAMLARVYLYTGHWAEAEVQAGAVIDHTQLYTLLPDLNAVFLANSGEAIWQFNTIGCQTNDGFSYEGYNFINGNDEPTFVLTSYLVDAFEANDQRKVNWIKPFDAGGTIYYYPFKYKLSATPTGGTPEYQMVLRLAEQYLIRAEARAQQSNLSGAEEDVDAIRHRAGLNGTTANDQASMLLAIEKERRVELFLEHGHRWFDLKRTGRADAVLGAIKPTWKSTAVLYPVPQKAISANPNLLPNNNGY